MPKESKFHRFVNPPYQTSARNSNTVSMPTTRNDVCESLRNSSTSVGASGSGPSENSHSAYQRPWTQKKTSCDFSHANLLRDDWFGEMRRDAASHKKSRNPDTRNSVLPQFNKENLKVFDKHLLDAMYRDKQCSNCGSRFTSEDIDKHLDMHFQINSVRRRTYRPCRMYYETVQDFLNGTTDAVPVFFANEDIHKIDPSKCEATKSGLLSTSIIDMCHACHEVISQFFNDDDEEWQLNDAVRIDGNVYHRICAQNVDFLKF